MKKTISKKAKILLICASAVVVAATVTTVAVLNIHNIYVWTQNIGLFRSPIECRTVKPENLTRCTSSELYSDSRVTFDQSLMLVNTQYRLPEDYKADILEYKDTTVYMSRPMLEHYAELSSAVAERTGKKLYVSSDFRSAEEQEALYREDPLTATLVGASEHQTGLALDVYVAYFSGDGFLKSPSGRFVNSECWKYGFIIRYPSYGYDVTGIRFEPWHIRYVGQPHAAVIYNNRMTLEAYISSLQEGTWYEVEGYLVCRQRLSTDGTLSLPDTYKSAVISPDNTGCYIITLK